MSYSQDHEFRLDASHTSFHGKMCTQQETGCQAKGVALQLKVQLHTSKAI